MDITESTSSSPMTMLMTLTVTSSQAQRAGDDADQQDSGDDAVQRAAAAEDRHAAEQHGRDDLQLEAGRVVAAGAAEAQRVVDAGERRDGAGQHEQHELGALDVDAGEVRRLGVQPDVEDAAAERREVQQQREGDREHERTGSGSPG